MTHCIFREIAFTVGETTYCRWFRLNLHTVGRTTYAKFISCVGRFTYCMLKCCSQECKFLHQLGKGCNKKRWPGQKCPMKKYANCGAQCWRSHNVSG